MALSVVRLMMLIFCYCLSTLFTLGARLPPALTEVRRPHYNKSTTAISTDLAAADESTSNGLFMRIAIDNCFRVCVSLCVCLSRVCALYG